MKLVAICGIKRSGSTAMYNIVRIALTHAGYDVLIRGHDFDVAELEHVEENQVVLCKRHPFSEAIANKADHIFLTDRNDEEILASLDRMWGSGDPERLEDMQKHLGKWIEYTDQQHIYKYSDLMYWDNWCIPWILKALHLEDKVDEDKVLREFQAIEPPTDKQDPVTLLFPNHISE